VNGRLPGYGYNRLHRDTQQSDVRVSLVMRPSIVNSTEPFTFKILIERDVNWIALDPVRQIETFFWADLEIEACGAR